MFHELYAVGDHLQNTAFCLNRRHLQEVGGKCNYHEMAARKTAITFTQQLQARRGEERPVVCFNIIFRCCSLTERDRESCAGTRLKLNVHAG